MKSISAFPGLLAALLLVTQAHLYDGGDGPSSGRVRFSTTKSWSSAALNFINDAHNKSSAAGWLDATVSGTGLYRGQHVLVPSEAIPEPGAIALASIGGSLMLLGWLWKCRKKTRPLQMQP
ncbi:MAG: hypothetical protein C4297_01395 [Gemmataceae bacterium]